MNSSGVSHQGPNVYDPQTGRSVTKSPEDDDPDSMANDKPYDRMYQSGPHPGVEGVHQFVGYLGDVADTAASFWAPYDYFKAGTGYDMFGRRLDGLSRGLSFLGAFAHGFGKLAEALDGLCFLRCFAEGTPVAMADGTYKAIEAVKAGDFVLSRDPAQSVVSRIEGKQVMQTSVRNNIHTLSLTFEDGVLNP